MLLCKNIYVMWLRQGSVHCHPLWDYAMVISVSHCFQYFSSETRHSFNKYWPHIVVVVMIYLAGTVHINQHCSLHHNVNVTELAQRLVFICSQWQVNNLAKPVSWSAACCCTVFLRFLHSSTQVSFRFASWCTVNHLKLIFRWYCTGCCMSEQQGAIIPNDSKRSWSSTNEFTGSQRVYLIIVWTVLIYLIIWYDKTVSYVLQSQPGDMNNCFQNRISTNNTASNE